MKLDIVPLVVLIFCLGVFASALAASDLFSSSSSETSEVAARQSQDSR